MKAIYLILPTLASAFGDIFTQARQEPFWEHDGNMCHKPSNINPKYTNLEIEFCPILVDQGLACKVTFDSLDANDVNSHHTVYIPQGVKYPALDDLSLQILEIQQSDYKLECNPCLLPQGNYKNSCVNYRVSYLPELHPNTPCLFQVDCDVNMKAMPVSKYNTKLNVHSKYQHNEALIGKELLFTDVKNYKGRIVTPSNKLEVSQDMCFASDSTMEVKINAGNAASTTATIFSSVVTAAATLALSM